MNYIGTQSYTHLEYEKNAISSFSFIGQQLRHRPLGFIVAEYGFLPAKEKIISFPGFGPNRLQVELTPKQREGHACNHA